MAEALSERAALGAASPAGQLPTLEELIAERDRLTQQTGHYCGVEELTLRDSDPIRYERFYILHCR
jgi:hypothetical protein